MWCVFRNLKAKRFPLYSTQHYFQDGHNIFSHITSEEYKEILGLIRQSILATDLAAFFPNLAKMRELQNEDPVNSKFTWSNNSHRYWKWFTHEVITPDT